jgi:hypothetical protein
MLPLCHDGTVSKQWNSTQHQHDGPASYRYPARAASITSSTFKVIAKSSALTHRGMVRLPPDKVTIALIRMPHILIPTNESSLEWDNSQFSDQPDLSKQLEATKA